MGGVEYVEVSANAIGINTLEVAPSGGAEDTTLAHVSWTNPGGFTGNGWFTGSYTVTVGENEITATGPLHGYEPERIDEAVSKGDLNAEFDAWEASVSFATRSAWVTYVSIHASGCVS